MIPAGFMATISTIIYQILQVDGFIMVYQPTARAGPGSHRVPSGPRAARPVFTNTDHGQREGALDAFGRWREAGMQRCI